MNKSYFLAFLLIGCASVSLPAAKLDFKTATHEIINTLYRVDLADQIHKVGEYENLENPVKMFNRLKEQDSYLKDALNVLDEYVSSIHFMMDVAFVGNGSKYAMRSYWSVKYREYTKEVYENIGNAFWGAVLKDKERMQVADDTFPFTNGAAANNDVVELWKEYIDNKIKNAFEIVGIGVADSKGILEQLRLLSGRLQVESFHLNSLVDAYSHLNETYAYFKEAGVSAQGWNRYVEDLATDIVNVLLDAYYNNIQVNCQNDFSSVGGIIPRSAMKEEHCEALLDSLLQENDQQQLIIGVNQLISGPSFVKKIAEEGRSEIPEIDYAYNKFEKVSHKLSLDEQIAIRKRLIEQIKTIDSKWLSYTTDAKRKESDRNSMISLLSDQIRDLENSELY